MQATDTPIPQPQADRHAWRRKLPINAYRGRLQDVVNAPAHVDRRFAGVITHVDRQQYMVDRSGTYFRLDLLQARGTTRSEKKRFLWEQARLRRRWKTSQSGKEYLPNTVQPAGY